MEKKAYREQEKIFKGVANHRRLEILHLLAHRSELSVLEIAENTSVDYRTLAEHLRKLTLAGLVMKKHEGAAVLHALTNRGKEVLKFCRTIV